MTETELLDRFEYLRASLSGDNPRRIGGNLSVRKDYDDEPFEVIVLFDCDDEVYIDKSEFVALAQWLTSDA